MSGNNIKTGAAFQVKNVLTDLESIVLEKLNKFLKCYIEIQSFYIPQHCTNNVFSCTNEIQNQLKIQHLGICSDCRFKSFHNLCNISIGSAVKLSWSCWS